MWQFVLPLLMQAAPQVPSSASQKSVAHLEQVVAQLEGTREASGPLVSEALASADTRIQKLAVRALGRTQKPEARDAILPFLRSPNVEVREEAANALGQINADVNFESLLAAEKNGSVRSVLYESLGRVKAPSAKAEQLLAAGLADASPVARVGAAKGLEALFRQRGRANRPSPETLTKIHSAFRANGGQTIRQLLLLSMNASADTNSATFALALRDTSAQVRRVAVLGTKKWVDDKSPLVRYHALRFANDCEHATQSASDASEMVVLAAIDMLGDRKCGIAPIQQFITDGTNWRVSAHAIVALAKVAPDSARRQLPAFATNRNWHSRVYAATAARVLGDTATLSKLARDTQPNVAMEAMTTYADAIHALGASHAGLVMTAANKLKGAPELKQLMPQLKAAFERPGMLQRASSADARDALAARMTEADPVVRVASGGPGTIPPQPLAQIAALRGATAQITMRGLGVIILQLMTDDAPNTVATFASLADNGKYNGLTLHRVVPNFVLQGGSPGADEYDGVTDLFMRDEVGRASHLRGTLGISTRGYDKGDGQIFINLVDNFRLDHQYTMFARITSGMNIVDKIQEGDVMESVKIIRKP